MKPLRIVVVLLEAPVPLGNAAARWYYVLLRELRGRGHRVTCFAACGKPEEMEAARELFPAEQYDLRLYPFPERSGLSAKWNTLRRPYSYMFSRELQSDLNRTLADGYDVLHLEQLWTGWLGPHDHRRAVVNVHYLFSTDLEQSSSHTRQSFLRHRFLTLRAERSLLRAYPHIVTLSERLRSDIRALAPAADVSVVPLGIDASLYDYIPDAERTDHPVVSVIGSMGWYPTHSAAVRLMTRLWPEIKRRVPDASVQLVGWNARATLGEFANLPDVLIAENVPEIRPYFEQTGVLLYAPGRGSGMKVKIMEALAFGVPVVTTSEGVEGLPAVDGIHAGVCEDDAGLIERTVKLLIDTELQNRQRAAGRVLLESHCGAHTTIDALERVYRSLPRVGSRTGRLFVTIRRQSNFHRCDRRIDRYKRPCRTIG